MNKYILFIFSILLFSCNSKPKKEALYGFWSKEIAHFYDDPINVDFNDTIKEIEIKNENISPVRYYPYGFAINENEFETFNAYTEILNDSASDKKIIKYYDNRIPYKLIEDSLFILDPIKKKWTLLWKIDNIKKDTLFVTLISSGKKRKYIRLKDYYIKNDFDKIVFSSTGCYGNCPILDIIIDKNGKIIFKGEEYVNQIGYFKKQLSKEETKYIFDKFNRLDLNKLKDKYIANHTDDEAYVVSLIKKGKIIKTITDYGLVAPRELIWCYDRIKNIQNKYKLDSINSKELFHPELRYFAFKKDSLILKLKKSESFYLWSELNNSQSIKKEFKAIYELIYYNAEDMFWDDKKGDYIVKKKKIKKILTDGRYYKIVYLDKREKVFDLGYNFIERNFSHKDFLIGD